MLPFDRKPWAKNVAATVIVVTLAAAIVMPLYLRHIRHLDPPMAVLIVLLVLAIVPPNIAIWRGNRASEANKRPRHAYAPRGAGH